MLFQVKARVNPRTMMEFGQKLQKGALDRNCIRGETHCLKNDPAIGFSIWEAHSREAFDLEFAPWRIYYEETEILEVITPQEAMQALLTQLKQP